MKSKIITGQLRYVDTQKGEIHIMDWFDGKTRYLNVDSQTNLPRGWSWEMLMGNQVEAVTVDGKTTKVYPTEA